MSLIDEAFRQESYQAIPFTLNGAGHPTIELQIKDETAVFLLDTGAASSLLDVEYAKKLSLPITILVGETGGGAGGMIHEIYSIGELDLFYGEIKFPFDQFLAMDFKTIKQALTAKGVEEEFQGILGFGFFKNNNCFIDYSKNRIFVKP